jgi:hypothetical protein
MISLPMEIICALADIALRSSPARTLCRRTHRPALQPVGHCHSSRANTTPMVHQAHVTGKVEYRQGDGANDAIRPGPVEVQTTPTDATLSWVDGETRGSAAMPIGDFQSYVSQGLIALTELTA